MTEVDRLVVSLEEMGFVQFSYFPGSNIKVTAEQVATEINKAIASIKSQDHMNKASS